MSIKIELRDLEMFWRGRAKALRAVHAEQPLGEATIRAAETYETCAEEIKGALASPAKRQEVLKPTLIEALDWLINCVECEVNVPRTTTVFQLRLAQAKEALALSEGDRGGEA